MFIYTSGNTHKTILCIYIVMPLKEYNFRHCLMMRNFHKRIRSQLVFLYFFKDMVELD